MLLPLVHGFFERMKRIQLGGHQRDKIQGYTIVDDEDYLLLNQWHWSLSNKGYAYRKENRVKSILLHRVVTSCPGDLIVDHINHNKLDNRRKNLRVCTQKENVRNRRALPHSSRYKGVYRDAIRNLWVAKIKVNYQGRFLGRFNNEIEAAKAYDEAAKKYFGEFSKLNFN